VAGGGGAEQPPMLKTSRGARFQGWWWMVIVQNSHQRRKQADTLVSEVGGRWWWWCRTATNIKNKQTCSLSMLVAGGSGAEQLSTAKISTGTCFRHWWYGWWLWKVVIGGGEHGVVVVNKTCVTRRECLLNAVAAPDYKRKEKINKIRTLQNLRLTLKWK
jgi:hypothetical protein